MKQNASLHRFLLLIILLSFSSQFLGQAQPDTAFNKLFRTENGGWVAGKVTSSIALPDGNTLWLLSTSYIGSMNADSTFGPETTEINNCAILQSGETLTALYQGTFENPLDFVQTDYPDSTWLWPEHGVVENDTIKILYTEYGPDVAHPELKDKYYNTHGIMFSYPNIETVGKITLPYYQQYQMMYGYRLVVDGNYTYIFGRRWENNTYLNVHLARAQRGNLLGPWEFWDGLQWRVYIQTSVPISGYHTCALAHEEKMVELYYSGGFIGGIYSQTADELLGPWVNPTLLYPIPYSPDNTIYVNPHPQFDEDNSLLISYNILPKDSSSNAEIYRPLFIRVPYTAIDSSFRPSGIQQYPDNENATVVINKSYPNPAHQKITILFTLKESATFEIGFYDAAGKKLKSLEKTRYSVGEHQVECLLKDFPLGVIVFNIQGKSGWFIHN